MADPQTLVLRKLDELDITYEVMSCDPAYADTAAFCEHYGVDPDVSANAILIASKRPPGSHALCLALATTKLDVNHTVRDLMAVRKLSFASAEETQRVTGMAIGGVTPFGLPEDVPIYVDSRVLERDEIIVGGGGRSFKVRLKPELLLRIPGLKVVEGLAH